MAKNVICLWYNGTAEDAARFYAQTFPNSAVTAVHRALAITRMASRTVLTVEFNGAGSTLPRPQWRSGLQTQRSFLVSDCDRGPGREPIVTGMRSFDNGEPKASAGGARTDGAYPGRSLRGRF